jgi:phage-related protein
MADLQVKISASIEGLIKNINTATARLETFSNNAINIGAALTKGLSVPLAAIGTAAFAASVRVGNFSDQILDLEQQTGLTTDAIQKYRAVTIQAGIATDTVATASQNLQRRLASGEEGSKDLTDGLAKLGITARDTAGNLKPIDTIVEQSISRLADFTDITERNQLALKIFGRSAADLAPLLALGSDGIEQAKNRAVELGLVLSKDALEGANEFRIAFDFLKSSIGGITNEIGLAFLPVAQKLVSILQEKIVPVVRSITGFFNGLSDNTKIVISVIGALVAAIGPLLLSIGAFIKIIPLLTGNLSAIGAAVTLATGPIGLIAIAIAGAAFVIIQNWDKVKKAFEDSGISKTLQDIGQSFVRIIGTIVSIFKVLVSNIKDFSNQLIADLSPFVVFIVDKFFVVIKTVLESVSNIFNNLKNLFTTDISSGFDISALIQKLETIKNAFLGLVKNVTAFLRVLITTVVGLFQSLVTKLEGFVVSLITVLKPFITFLVDTFLRNVQFAIEGISQAFGFLKNILEGDFSTAFERLNVIFLSLGKNLLESFAPVLKLLGVNVDALIANIGNKIDGINQKIAGREAFKALSVNSENSKKSVEALNGELSKTTEVVTEAGKATKLTFEEFSKLADIANDKVFAQFEAEAEEYNKTLQETIDLSRRLAAVKFDGLQLTANFDEFGNLIQGTQKKIDLLGDVKIVEVDIQLADTIPIQEVADQIIDLGNILRTTAVEAVGFNPFSVLVDSVNRFKELSAEIAATTDIESKLNLVKEQAFLVGDAFATLGGVIGQAFAGANQKLKGFISAFADFAGQIIARAFAVSKANAIVAATSTGSAAGPAAAFVTPGLIASGLALIASAFRGIGGVGGSSSGGGSFARGGQGQTFAGSQTSGLFESERFISLALEPVISGDQIRFVLDQSNQRRN